MLAEQPHLHDCIEPDHLERHAGGYVGHIARDRRAEPASHGDLYADYLRCGEAGLCHAVRGLSRHIQSVHVWHVYAATVYPIKWSVLRWVMNWSRLKLIFFYRVQVRDLQRSAVPNRETSTRIHGPHWPRHSFDVHVVCPRLRRFLKSHTYVSKWEKNIYLTWGEKRYRPQSRDHELEDVSYRIGIALDRRLGHFSLCID